MVAKASLKGLAFAVTMAAFAQQADAATYIGSYQVDDGPNWTINPTVYSAAEAAALLFGGVASDYDISTIDSNPANINNMGWYSIWGVSGGTAYNEDYKLDLGGLGYNNPGGVNTAASAYVDDNAIGRAYTNFVFRADGGVGAVPEPATWAMMLIGFGAVGGAMRYKRKVKASLSFA